MPSSVDVTDYSLIPTSAAPVKFSYERRFKLPFDVPIILFLSRGKIQHCICKKKKTRSSASVRFKSPSWNIHGLRLEREEKLDW